jgi:hypothetical protein
MIYRSEGNYTFSRLIKIQIKLEKKWAPTIKILILNSIRATLICIVGSKTMKWCSLFYHTHWEDLSENWIVRQNAKQISYSDRADKVTLGNIEGSKFGSISNGLCLLEECFLLLVTNVLQVSHAKVHSKLHNNNVISSLRFLSYACLICFVLHQKTVFKKRPWNINGWI